MIAIAIELCQSPRKSFQDLPMKSAVASLFFFMIFPVVCRGAFTDFEDLADGTFYPVGVSIDSKGLSFEVIPFPSPTGLFSSSIIDQFGSLQTIGLSTGYAALDFKLTKSANHISLDYRIGDNGTGLFINGVATPLSNSFDPLDGTIVGGALISLTTPTSVLFNARLVISGDIDSFAIGGVELFVDNVRVFIPEPTAIALVLVAMGILGCRRF
jgi:hypothetical protein